MTWARARDVVWTLLGVAGLLYVAGSVLGLIASGVLLFALGAVIAFVLSPPVSWLERRAHLGRGPAAGVVYAVLLLALGVLGTWGVSALGAQLAALAAALPAMLERARERLPEMLGAAGLPGSGASVPAAEGLLVSELQRTGASQGLAWAGTLGVTAVNVFLVLVLSFYMVVDGGRLADAAVAVAPARAKPYLLFGQKTLLRVVGGYLRGQLAMGAIVGTGVFLLCLALGIRYSAALAALAFVCELMPMVGPALMGASVGLVGFADSFRLALLGVAAYYLFRTAAVYVVGPRIIHRTVGVHPIATTLGLVVGVKLFGVWGVIFAAPVMGFVLVVAETIYREVQSRRREAQEQRPRLVEETPRVPEAA